MSVILVLMLASLAVALAFLFAFIWAVRSGQYEDTSTPSLRILADDPLVKPTRAREASLAGAPPATEQKAD